MELVERATEKDKLGFNRVTKETVTDSPKAVTTTVHGKATKTVRNFKNITKPGITRTTTVTPSAGSGETSNGTRTEKTNLGFRLAFSIPITARVPTNC